MRLTYDTAKAGAVIAATAVVGFILYKMYATGQGAAASVRETLGSIGDSLSATWHEFKGGVATVRNTIAPGEIGPAGGGSRQELQKMPTPEDEGLDRLNEISPYMLGQADTVNTAYTYDSVGVSYADDASYGVASPQVYSPDAMGSA